MKKTEFIEQKSSPDEHLEKVTPSNPLRDFLGYTHDLIRLKSALSFMPPSTILRVVVYHFLVPMVKEAREFPEIAGEMKALACSWSCGELNDGPPSGLMNITVKEKSGKALFEELWTRTVSDTTYKGETRSLGSVYHLAKEAGWHYAKTGTKP